MVAIKQKEIEEEESREESWWQKEKEAEKEEEKQNELREEEVRIIRTWSEEESRKYVERFRGYKGDMRCRKCRWFGHMAHHCRRMEIKAEREQRGGSCENRWELLRCRVMASEEERKVAYSARREAQQMIKCWGCEEEGHYLWTCPKRAACPEQREAQQRKLICNKCKGENHVARNCDSYWRWREQEVKRKLKELKEKPMGEERVLRHTVQPLREIWMKFGIEKVDTHEGVTVKALLDSSAMGMFVERMRMDVCNLG